VALVLLGIRVGFIVTDGNAVGVIKEEGLELYVEVVVFVDVFDIVPVDVGTTLFIRRFLSKFTSCKS
jgi:hypothetical protein